MEQNTVAEAIRAILGDDRKSASGDAGSNVSITINGNVTITVQAPPGTSVPVSAQAQ